MNQVTKPLLDLGVGVSFVCWHVECSLAEECLGVGRHVGQVVHNHEHLHHCPQGIEQRQLDRSFLWYPVSLLAEVNVALRERGDICISVIVSVNLALLTK